MRLPLAPGRPDAQILAVFRNGTRHAAPPTRSYRSPHRTAGVGRQRVRLDGRQSGSFSLLDRFLEAGLNAIDTADIYSNWAPGHQGGESETIIGEWLQKSGKRRSTIVITKFGGPGGRKKGLTAQAIETGLRGFAEAAGDRDDRPLPLAFPRRRHALRGDARRLRAAEEGGKNSLVRRLQPRMPTSCEPRSDAAKAAGLPRYEVLQPEYNLYDRASYDGPLRELCLAEEIGVITYFSLAKGFLSGKYHSEADLETKPARRRRERLPQPARVPHSCGARDGREAPLGQARRNRACLADSSRGVTAPIASATTLAQLESLIRAATLELSSEDVAALDAASAP